MAREATITQEQVNAIADTIRAGGTKPTARGVRETLGGGSMATVLKFLQVWQAGQVRTAESPVVLPVGLQRALVDFIGQEVAGAKAELQADLVAAQQANGDLIAEVERQASTIELQAEALESVQAEKAELAGRLAQVESDLAKAGDDVGAERQAAEHARTELAKAQLRLESLPRLEAEADRLRGELGQERTAKVAAQQAAAVATEKGTGLAERLTEAKARVESLEKQGQASAAAQEKAKEREFALSDSIHKLQSELFAANAATMRAEAQGRHALDTVAQLEKQLGATQPKADAKPKTATKKAEG
jgi:chromosome segregation ATPase